MTRARRVASIMVIGLVLILRYAFERRRESEDWSGEGNTRGTR